jgi:hypothetical protein
MHRGLRTLVQGALPSRIAAANAVAQCQHGGVVAALLQGGGQSSSKGFRLLGILSSVESLARAQQQSSIERHSRWQPSFLVSLVTLSFGVRRVSLIGQQC